MTDVLFNPMLMMMVMPLLLITVLPKMMQVTTIRIYIRFETILPGSRNQEGDGRNAGQDECAKCPRDVGDDHQPFWRRRSGSQEESWWWSLKYS